MILIPNGCQTGPNFDAKTHQKVMPKQVTEKIVKIIKNHVSLMCKNMRIHCKNNGCLKIVQVACANAGVITNYQNVYQIPFQNRLETNVNPCSR